MSRFCLALQACLLVWVLLVGITTGAITLSPMEARASSRTPRLLPPTASPTLRESAKTHIYLPSVRTERAPHVDVFWADRYRLEAGECTQIHWSVKNVIAVYLDNEPVTGQGTRQICPHGTHTYLLRVVGASGTQDYCVTIVVEPGSYPAIEFSADAYQIRRGECTILHWRVTGASAVYLNNVGVAGESSQQVCPEVGTTYELRVVSTDGTVTTKRITISVVSADEPLLHFWADQYTLAANACTVLSWNVQNVREVYLDDQPVVGQGSKSVCPQPNQLFTLRVTDNAGESSERSIKFFVGDPALAGPEVIAHGIVNDVAPTIDTDPNLAGDQPGYRLVIDGINALYTGTAGWSQSAVTLMVQQADIPSDPNADAPVDWPINPGQQVEFRAFCNSANCYIHTDQGSYLRWRSE